MTIQWHHMHLRITQDSRYLLISLLGLKPRRGTTDATFAVLLHKMMEKHREKQKGLHSVFIYLEKESVSSSINSIQFNSVYFQHTSTFHTITTTCTFCAGKGADRRQCLWTCMEMHEGEGSSREVRKGSTE